MISKLDVKQSLISGRGVFSLRPIKKDETIYFLSGREISLRELVGMINNLKKDAADPLQIDVETYIDLNEFSRLFNHSCNPNAFIRGKNELVALMDIDKEEEITYDYSTTMWENKEKIESEFNRKLWTMQCHCNSTNCRKLIDQFYFLPLSVQEYYFKNRLLPDFILQTYTRLRLIN